MLLRKRKLFVLLLLIVAITEARVATVEEENDHRTPLEGHNPESEDIPDEAWSRRDNESHIYSEAIDGDGLDRRQDKTEYYIWNKEEYPNPVTQPRFCRRMYHSHLCDPDDILSPNEARNIEKLISLIGGQLQCYCEECPVGKHGLSVGIALMAGIYRPYTALPADNAAEFGDYLRHKWKLGTCDNDVIILIAIKDQQIYTSLGRRAKDVLPAQAAKKILESSKTHFTSGEYYQGLELMVQGYYDVLKSEEQRKLRTTEPPPPVVEEEDDPGIGLAVILSITFGVLLLILIITVIIWLLIKRRREQSSVVEPTDWQSLWATLTMRKRASPSEASEGGKKGAYSPVSIEAGRQGSADKGDEVDGDEGDSDTDIEEEMTAQEQTMVKKAEGVGKAGPGDTEYAAVSALSRTAKTLETDIP